MFFAIFPQNPDFCSTKAEARATKERGKGDRFREINDCNALPNATMFYNIFRAPFRNVSKRQKPFRTHIKFPSQKYIFGHYFATFTIKNVTFFLNYI